MDERVRIERELIDFYEFNRLHGFPDIPLGKTHTAWAIIEGGGK